jgi:hypothetical protein
VVVTYEVSLVVVVVVVVELIGTYEVEVSVVVVVVVVDGVRVNVNEKVKVSVAVLEYVLVTTVVIGLVTVEVIVVVVETVVVAVAETVVVMRPLFCARATALNKTMTAAARSKAETTTIPARLPPPILITHHPLTLLQKIQHRLSTTHKAIDWDLRFWVRRSAYNSFGATAWYASVPHGRTRDSCYSMRQ